MKTITKTTSKRLFKTVMVLGIIASMTASCSNDDDNPEEVDEEEVITTMNVSLTAAGTSRFLLQSQDLDGDGPEPPVITVSDDLAANTTYAGSIELLNETESPAEDITLEVEEEADEHQFFFNTTGSINTISYDDTDADGNPVGILFELTTGDAGSGTIQITLRHEPKKPNDGTLADAGGSTDIAQTFSLTVQ